MPHFDANGNEEWVCQKGGHICTGPSTWVKGLGNVCPKCLSGDKGLVAANAAAKKGHESELSDETRAKLSALPNEEKAESNRKAEMKMHDALRKSFEEARAAKGRKGALVSLTEHCRQESGGLTGPALDRYINRHYGHGLLVRGFEKIEVRASKL